MPLSQGQRLEKELPWGMVPPDEHALYCQAEENRRSTWTLLSVEKSEEALRAPSTILRARFAYKGKNHAKRKVDKTIPRKPMAKLCVAGRRDPDLP